MEFKALGSRKHGGELEAHIEVTVCHDDTFVYAFVTRMGDMERPCGNTPPLVQVPKGLFAGEELVSAFNTLVEALGKTIAEGLAEDQEANSATRRRH